LYFALSFDIIKLCILLFFKEVINIEENKQKDDELQEKKLTHKDYVYLKKTIILILFMFAFLILLLILIFDIDLKKEKIKEPKFEYINTQNNDYFIYYNEELYIRDENVVIKSTDDVGDVVTKVDYHLTIDDIYNNSFKYYLDNKTYVFAQYADTNIYQHKHRDDVLLIESNNAFNGYYIYIKNGNSSYITLDNFINNKMSYDDFNLVGYFMKEININKTLSEFKKNPVIYDAGGTDSLFIGIQLLIEDDFLCRRYDGFANLLSNMIFINDVEYINETQYIPCQYVISEDTVSRQLIESYSDFLQLDKQLLLDILDGKYDEGNVENNVTPSPTPEITPEVPNENNNKPSSPSLNYGQDNLIPID